MFRLPHLPHLFVVMMSEVQFVLGALLRLPWVDIVWILKQNAQFTNITVPTFNSQQYIVTYVLINFYTFE